MMTGATSVYCNCSEEGKLLEENQQSSRYLHISAIRSRLLPRPHGGEHSVSTVVRCGKPRLAGTANRGLTPMNDAAALRAPARFVQARLGERAGL